MDEQVEEVNRYKLPEGLREAAYARIKSFDGLVGNGTLTENRIDMILEEAKKWYAPEPESPEAIKDLLTTIRSNEEDHATVLTRWANEAIREAYRRGRRNPARE